MKTVIGNDIKVSGYSDELFRWCEENLVLDNPDYLVARRLGKFVGNMPPKMRLFSKRAGVLVLPFGSIKKVWKLIKDGEVSYDFAHNEPNSMQGGFNLYPHQKLALEALKTAKSGILQAPCGSGKTQIALQLVYELKLKTLWVTHTLDLLNQSRERVMSAFKGDFGTINGGMVSIGKDITFATVQTLDMLDLPSLKYEFDCIIVDECHKVAGSPTKVMQFYRVLSNLAARYKFGLSATVHRSDNLIKSTFAILGDVVYEITREEVGDKIVRATREELVADTPESFDYLDTDGTLVYTKLVQYLSACPERNKLICDEIQRCVSEKRRILVLCDLVEHCFAIARLLGFGEVVVGSTSVAKRTVSFERMRSGEAQVLIATYALAKEGLDVPQLDTLFWCSPHKDFAIVKQSAGRIERALPDKMKPIVYDVVDSKIGYCVKMSKRRKSILKK